FIGDVMHDGSKLVTWFDTEWDYGFAKGIDALVKTAEQLEAAGIDLALPSHGPAIRNPSEQFKTYREKLSHFRKSYVRGYPVFDSTKEDRDTVSKPTQAPHINRISPHLYKLAHEYHGKNFAMIVSDNGKGLILDCGLFPERMLDEIIAGMKKHLGLKQVDALWISHLHGDHFLLGPALKKKYGAKMWTLDRIADKCENPRRYDFAALVSAYSDGFDGMKIDKAFRDGETMAWEGYTLQVDWMPGQTQYGCSLWLEIDGMRVVFTGDNLFGNPEDMLQDGHEAVVARNSGIFEEGYLYASEYLLKLKPDLMIGGHSFVMHDPMEFIQRYNAWAKRIIELYQDLLPDPDYEYLFDPYWVSAYPYRIDLGSAPEEASITIRNFRGMPQRHRVELKLPPGVTAEPQVLEGTLQPESQAVFKVHLRADTEKARKGIQIVPFDITLDGKRYGELFDVLIRTEE
ncbi:MAG: MBL fold metallo-hydrolase, partial [Verrucomicrobiota bacterium]